MGKFFLSFFGVVIFSHTALATICDLTDIAQSALGSCGAASFSIEFPEGGSGSLDLNDDGTVDANVVGEIDVEVGSWSASGDTLTINFDSSVAEQVTEALGGLMPEGVDFQASKVKLVIYFTCGGGIEVHLVIEGPATVGGGNGNLTVDVGGFAPDPDGPEKPEPPTVTGGATVNVTFDPNPEEEDDEKKEKVEIPGEGIDGIKIKITPHCNRKTIHKSFLAELFGK
ncbi:MAG: hypothetical protein KDD53_06435 [Bdellovibrionales bacterium]|nr:hypothetical protein [Bdellovibrionales bacterium]